MRVLKFNLKGKTAFFKNPEVNSYFYFTYGNIHKPVLLGMFGAILGLNGYEAGYVDFPDYYKMLRDIKISVVPSSFNGYFPKKIQYFNNSVGYASQEQGGNLIIKEQWLEDPSWTIYVALTDEISEELADMLLKNRCIYMPYLGKNDHPATIEDVLLKEVKESDKTERIHSLVPAHVAEFDWDEAGFKYEEYLPVALKASTNLYEMQKFILTDAVVEFANEPVYSDGEKNIVFY